MRERYVDPRFAPRMRELLAERGISYRALAARTFYAKSYLNDLAHGRKLPTAEIAERVDEALDAGGELAAMVSSGGTDDSVQRRTLVAALAGLGLAPVVERAAIARLMATAADRQPGRATVDDWHEVAWEYGFTYLTAPRRELLDDLAADLAAVVALLGTTTETASVCGLSEAAGRLAGLIAMVCTDLGYGREARRSWLVARRLADDSGSMSTRTWVRGNEAVLGLYAQRPLPVVLELADRGLELAGDANVGGAATLASARAQALALLGDQRAAMHELGRVRDRYDRLPTDLTDQRRSAFAQPTTRLRHTESFVYAHAGRTTDAYDAQDQALALYASAAGVGRSQVQLHRAACLVRDGAIDEGIDHAAATLDELGDQARGQFVLTVAEAVHAAVPAGERRRSAAVDFGHTLATLRPRR
jgi:transcriptional regulator with XRE-family HTH domain